MIVDVREAYDKALLAKNIVRDEKLLTEGVNTPTDTFCIGQRRTIVRWRCIGWRNSSLNQKAIRGDRVDT